MLAALGVARTPGMEVNLKLSHAGATCYVLRWETLPRNRDQPRAEIPPPSELRLYEIPDPRHELTRAEPVGS